MARPPFKSTSFSFAQSSYHAGPGSSVSMISPTTTTSVSFGTTPTFSSSTVNKKTITLATTSCAPPPYSSPGDALELLERLARRAAANPADRGGPADILLVAEAFIGGYPRGSTFGAAVGQRSAEGREEWLRYWNCAVDLGEDERGQDFFRDLEEEDDGSGMAEKTVDKSARRGDGTRETLERIARDTGVFLVVGMIEKDGGSLYCSVAYVESRRGIIGRRRKVMPTGTERIIWAQGSASTLRAVSTVIRGTRVNLAAAICWESYMPLLRQALYSQNINLYLAPTADGRDTWQSLMRTIALEGRAFVVSANMCLREQQPSAGTAAAAAVEDAVMTKSIKQQQQEEEETSYKLVTCSRTGRRSYFTPEGFEIVIEAGTGPFHPDEIPTCPARRERERAASIEIPREGKWWKQPENYESEEGYRLVIDERTRRRSYITPYGHEIVIDSGSGKSPPSPPGSLGTADEETKTTKETGPQTLQQEKNDAATSPLTTPIDAEVETRHNTRTISSKLAPRKGGFISRGGSLIVSPFGDFLAGPSWEDDSEEGILYARVDMNDCVRGRLDLDVASGGGSYARPDAFKFSVEGLKLRPLPY